MKTLINTSAGLVLKSIPDPSPGPNQALVAVRAFSVNRGELALLAARTEDWRPGQDIAGVVVEAAADGSGPAAGTRVVGLVEDSGWAELAAVPTGRLAELPDEVEIEQAAALPLAGRTALNTIRLGGNLLGRKVLVTGATGGVGHYQVQLAVLSGADVAAVSRSGAEYRAAKTVSSVTDADGLYDLVAESSGGESLHHAIAKITPGGTVVVLGTSSGAKTPIDVYDFIGHEGARLVNYMSYADPSPINRDLQTLAELVAQKKLTTDLGFHADWTQVEAALDGLQHRTFRGKAVLTVQ
ncbi:zinc-binding dehydrogenase [Kribbella monticola]|uniref:zinc-binding dehydrogenase n=1 Tax=Kribbella monticola TaxID=2185285 RepID=UPI000DD3ED69|nr:zinc-binding dehydrogenase [Kribbella monticola]